MDSLFPQSNSIARCSFRSTDPARVSNLKVQLERNRDQQCRCFTRCSTSMTIAGNFVLSVCVLSPLLPPSPLPRNPFSFTSPFIPSAFLYLVVLGRSIQFAGSEFVRGGNLFSVTSRRPQSLGPCVSHARIMP